MRRLALFLTGLALLVLACGLLTPAAPPTPVPGSSPTKRATITSVVPPSPTITPLFTLTPVPPTPAPPPAASSPETGYVLQEEHFIDRYAIRIWRNPDDQLGFESILLIETAGRPPVRVDMVSALHELTGMDINADGYPDLVVETYSGGAHCCFGTQVFSLRPTGAALILKKPESNAGGTFEDLNGDAILEFITYDDSFAYQYCPYVAGVLVKAIMAYDPGSDRYLPASPRFAAHYTEEIAADEERAQHFPGKLGEWDGSNICAILPLSLDYLYIGQPERAQAEFNSRYSGSDRNPRWTEILKIVQSSFFYTP